MPKEDNKKDSKNKGAEVEEAEETGVGKEGEASEGGEGGEAPSKSKFGKHKKLILITAAIVVALVIAVPAVLFLTGKFSKSSSPGGEMSAENAGKVIYYDMEELIINLNVGNKRPSFLKMTVSLEVSNELQIMLIEKNMPRVRDSFQTYLRELRQEDLQGSAGLYRLREELLLRVNKAVYPAKVNDILFKEILVQ